MNPEVKELWLEALRSGRYKQGERALAARDDGDFTYCCLGVLCDLAVRKGVIPDPREFEFSIGYGALGADAFLPVEVQVWADLEYANPSAQYRDGTPVSLSFLNDEGVSFADIATIIERNF